MTSLQRDAERYERWLRKQCHVVEADLQKKHQRMGESAFDCLRATYFRWARRIEEFCPGLAVAPKVLCVGDIHVQNYGTWRDAQARWVWGVNDFDEAAVMPYAYDLVRLATSARLAPTLQIDPKHACDAILDGYLQGLCEPRPQLVDEHVPWLRALLADSAKSASKYWQELQECEEVRPPAAARRAVERSLPRGAKVERFIARVKGSGSLGRPRFQAMARWQGGWVVREAKAHVPSAWHWAHPDAALGQGMLALARGPFRAPDPHLSIRNGFVVRREAPDAHKVELKDVPKADISERLLHAMGEDLGAVHAAHRQRRQVLEDLLERDAGWLQSAAEIAVRALRRDFDSLSASESQPLVPLNR